MKLQNLQALPPPQSLVNQARLSLSGALTRLQQSAATLYQTTHRKLKPAVAVAALIAGSVFGSTAQAEILQLDFSGTIDQSYDSTHLGESFSGYLFLDTSQTPSTALGLSYFGYSFISTPFATGTSYPYTNNPENPFTGSPVPNNASSPYLIGAFNTTTTCDLGFCDYNNLIFNDDGSNSLLYFSIRQSSNANVLITSPTSFAGAEIYFDLNYGSGQLFYGTGTISLPAVTPPPVSAVPEPASWAMLLLGVGMVGGAARYRRRQSGNATSQYHFA